MSLRLLLKRLTTAFWAVPAVGALLAAIGALVVVWVDREYGGAFGVLYGGGPDSAREVLGTVASSVLTFAGLTFSITVVALQLASSQFSPRVLNTLLRDRWTQAALAVFVGTFVFSLLMLREVRGGEDTFVPGLGVGVSLLLGLTSIGTLVGFIHHMAQSLRVVTIIDRIHRETRRALDTWYSDDGTEGAAGRRAEPVSGRRRTLPAPADGVVAMLTRGAAVRYATEHDCTLELLVPAGTWVVEGQPLLAVHGGDDAEIDVRSVLGLGRERETATDPPYGFRQLVDIAERALSPGVNDPTTAVQCLDRMHGLLRRIARRDLDVGDTAVDGVVRLRVPVPSWADFLGLACDEIRHWGADSPRVHRRMESMLRDLADVAPRTRVAAVEEQLARLAARRDETVAQEWPWVSAHGDPAEWLGGREPDTHQA